MEVNQLKRLSSHQASEKERTQKERAREGEMEVNQKEIIHPTHEEEEEEEEHEEEDERCLKASQSPCFPSLAPKSQKKQESLLPHTNPFLPSSSSWEDCFSPPSHHLVFPDNMADIPHKSNNPFLPPSIAADDPDPVLEQVLEKPHEKHGPNSSHDPPAEEKEKKEVSDSGQGGADKGGDQDDQHHHKKWFSLPKLDPRHRWPQGWC